MITPPHLKSGDCVSIVSTARKIDEKTVTEAVSILNSWGLNVRLGHHLFEEENQFAGSDEQRAEDLQLALDDPDCKAIFCARGGYGTIRLLEKLNFDQFTLLPKWVIGYSDITFLHSHIQKVCGIESLHASMPVNFTTNTETSLNRLRSILFGERLNYSFLPQTLNKTGSGRGIVAGGNLSILYSLKGSPSFPNLKGRILFIEDLDEYLYHIDRMMISLKRAGVLEHLTGLIVGGMTKMNDNQVPFGKTAEEIIRDSVSEYLYPVCFGFPAGHIDDNNPLILGRSAELHVTAEKCSLSFS